MLKLNKHTDPSLSVLNIAGMTIEILQQNKILTHDELLASLIHKTSKSVEEVFLYALSFLYIVGKLEYIPEIDALRISQ